MTGVQTCALPIWDKIPIKVRTEGLMLPKSHKGDAGAKNGKVDVYRGCTSSILFS